MAEFLKAIDEAGRRRGRVAHALGDLGHAELVLLREKTEQTVLGERNVSARQFLGKLEDEAALQGRENIGQALGISPQSGFFAGGRSYWLRALTL